MKNSNSYQLQLERLSSAYTLSDMEIFIFPELFYPLVLSNIMSPIIWKWREDPWFDNIETKNFNYRINRVKQYIIDNFVFNLDLYTWGLTTKKREIDRFKDFFDIESLRRSNALFGYEGDKYYYDIDIRRHFGLDKFTTNTIPYWKTETIEAMVAFRRKEGFTTGAGECVSLAALYAAAMFIVGRIPLENIFLMATPLHSQNFITEKEGLLTNNRRIVTKNMWYNGTPLSTKARRAIENEKITIVSHISGYIHTLYDHASIAPEAYRQFSSQLISYLKTEPTPEIFCNFLRFKSYKGLFLYRCKHGKGERYISVEKLFEYEHQGKFKASPETRNKLIDEIDGYEFSYNVSNNTLILNDVEEILIKSNNLEQFKTGLIEHYPHISANTIGNIVDEFSRFICTTPRLPENKKFVSGDTPIININDSREDIIKKIYSSRDCSESALLTLYVYREMSCTDWQPFIKAALERNPVCCAGADGLTYQELYHTLCNMDNESIYDSCRLAQPDEVWNYHTGDGIEKALLMADVILFNNLEAAIEIEITPAQVAIHFDNHNFIFSSSKGFTKKISLSGVQKIVID